MTVTVDQVKIGFRKFVENEVAYKATGLTKFLTFFLLPSIDKEVISLISRAKDSQMLAEFFTPEGNIIIDEIYSRAVGAVEKSGKIAIEKFQLTLDRSDLEKIYYYIKES